MGSTPAGGTCPNDYSDPVRSRKVIMVTQPVISGYQLLVRSEII